jgi:hypothetical protein
MNQSRRPYFIFAASLEMNNFFDYFRARFFPSSLKVSDMDFRINGGKKVKSKESRVNCEHFAYGGLG